MTYKQLPLYDACGISRQFPACPEVRAGIIAVRAGQMLNKPKGRLLSDRLRRPEEATFHYVNFGGITGFVVARVYQLFLKRVVMLSGAMNISSQFQEG